MCLSINGPLNTPYDSDFILERPTMSPVNISLDRRITVPSRHKKQQLWSNL